MSSCTLPWTRVTSSSPSTPDEDRNVLETTATFCIKACSPNDLHDGDDSAFIEPEYSNTSGSNPASYQSYTNRSAGSSGPISCEEEDGTHHARPYRQEDYEEDDEGDYSSPCPDYEEVDPMQIQRLRESLQLTSPPCVRNEVTRRKRNAIVTNGGLVYNLATEGMFSPTNKNCDFSFNSITPKKNYYRISNSHQQNQQAFIAAATVAAANVYDPVTKQKIMKSNIFCIHKDEGCNWAGQLTKLKAHLNVCQKDAVGCLNQCGAKIARVTMEDHMLYTCSKRLVSCAYCRQEFTGAVIEEHTTKCGFEPVYCEAKCGQRIQRNRIRAHMINTCSKRMVGCAYCARNYTADTLQSHHAHCRRFPITCPNKCRLVNKSEFVSIPREDVEKHLQEECPVRMMITTPNEGLGACTYKEAGCRFAGTNLEGHLRDNAQLHLDLMCSLAHKQEANIRRLAQQLDRAQTSYNGVLIWKIKDVTAKMAEAKAQSGSGCLELVSVPFYTSHQCGYRLQASLFLNGNGAGENSHMSVYIKLLPGEYDGILRWPFKHTVSFTMLDQTPERRDAVNVVESFLPDPTWPNFQRPSKQPDQLGFGFPKFVPHELLTARNYIKDDALFIKIRVDPSRNIAV